MTDATAGRGGVGIRLYVNGGEVAKRTFDDVANSGRKMWGQIALGEKSANPALRALSAGVGEARSGVEGLAGRAGPAASVLNSFGAAGLTAAAGIGGLALALNAAQDAAQWAAELTDTADRIGVGVEQLQAWHFVADEAGVSTQTFQANLEKLNGVLGAFKSGIGDGKLKPVFEELGITTDQLKNVQTADQLMLILADTLGQVKDRALQVKFARSLGIEESLPILRLGSQGIRDLSDDAERLGLVMGRDVVKALDEADRKLELAQQRINATVRLAVADLAGDFADLVTQIAGAVVQLARWDAQVQRMSGAGQRPGRGLLDIASDTIRGRTAEEGEAARDQGARSQGSFWNFMGLNQRRREALDREAGRRRDLTDLADGTGEYAEQTGGGYDPRGHTARGGSSRGSGEAERRQRERERALDVLQRQELEAQRAAIQARFGPGGTEESSLDLARANLTIDIEAQDAARAALRAQLQKAGALDAEAEARLDQLHEAQKELAITRDRRIDEDERRRVAAERLRAEQVSERGAIDFLSIQQRMAGTARERYEIGRRILEAEQALERKLLRAAVDEDGKVTGDERRRLTDQTRNQAAELDLFDHERREELRQTFKSYGQEVVQAIEDGRIGEYIGDRIKARLLDGALDALFNATRGGVPGGAGGLLGSAASWAVNLFRPGGGRAAGGDVRDSMVYRMAEHGPELLLLGGQGQVTSAAETARMVRDLAGTGNGRSTQSGPPVAIHMGDRIIHAAGADSAALARVESRLDEMDQGLEQRAVEAVADYRDRTHGGG